MDLKDMIGEGNNLEGRARPEPSVKKIEVHRVGPSFGDVLGYAATGVRTPEGVVVAIDLRKMQELEGRFGYNGGVGCDVLSGPCSCGAWH